MDPASRDRSTTPLRGDGVDVLSDILDRFGPWMRSRIRAAFPLEWEDVLQEALVRLARSVPSMRSREDEALRALVSKTVRSVCVDEFRRRALRRRTIRPEMPADVDLADDGVPEPGSRASATEEQSRLERAVRTLQPRDRRIIQLRFRDGMGFREIAALLGVPQGSVAGWYSRAMAALREVVA